MPYRLLLVLFPIVFSYSLSGQPSPIHLQVGLSGSMAWLKGENELSAIEFRKKVQKPFLFAGLSVRFSDHFFLSTSIGLQPINTDYRIPSVDVFNRPVVLEYRSESVLAPLSLLLNYRLPVKLQTALAVGAYGAVNGASKRTFLNLSTFDFPVFAPSYGEIELDKLHFGIQTELTQPLVVWLLSSLDLRVFCAWGLNNSNRDKANPVRTRAAGAALVWNVNTKPRKR